LFTGSHIYATPEKGIKTVNPTNKAYGQFSSTVTQRPTSLDPVKIVFDTHQDKSGDELGIDFVKGFIQINRAGPYLIIAGPQIGKLAGNKGHWIDFWIRVNETDIPNSTVRAVLKDPEEKIVIVTQAVTHLKQGDMLNIMMSVEVADEGLGIEAFQPLDEPLIPSIILTILQL
jgi:hypothetical protein